MIQMLHGDCLEVMRTMPDGCVDAVVTDPPAGIRFMGAGWDTFPIRKRPGVSFADGRRRPGVAEGQEYRRSDREPFIAFMTTVMVECLRLAKPGAHALVWALPRTSHWTAMATEDAGWIIEDRITHHFGQGFPKHKSKLKPATEDWWLCTKPGGKKWLNVDGCRIASASPVQSAAGVLGGYGGARDGLYEKGTGREYRDAGRWPANLVLSHHPDCNGECVEGCPVAEMDGQSGQRKSGGVTHQPKRTGYSGFTEGRDNGTHVQRDPDSGGASRFFYCSKASKADRGEGNTHPTVKSSDLMRWLCRLITPSGGTILDPFMGSGSTLLSATMEGFSGIGIEQDPGYFAIAQRRLASVQPSLALAD